VTTLAAPSPTLRGWSSTTSYSSSQSDEEQNAIRRALGNAMGYFVAQLARPYDWRVLIETYVYTRRKDFVHQDFNDYYRSLLDALHPLFGVDMSGETLSFDQDILWSLFNSTVDSLLQITSPWSGYLEAGLIHTKLREHEETERRVREASSSIHDANQRSEEAHREMLAALFIAVFGDRPQVITSDQLRAAGFDDSNEPDIKDYYEYM
jgi:hypothetical protein